eukprot:scaffold128020_cov47-Attheya_sp.AAC.1
MQIEFGAAIFFCKLDARTVFPLFENGHDRSHLNGSAGTSLRSSCPLPISEVSHHATGLIEEAAAVLTDASTSGRAKLKAGAPLSSKNKGSLNDIDLTPRVDCFIQQAWDVRSEIVRLKLPSKEDTLTPAPGAAATSTKPPLAENPAILVVIMRVVTSESQSEFGKASDVLQSDGFIGSINKCFNSTGNVSIATEVNGEMMKLGNQLQ